MKKMTKILASFLIMGLITTGIAIAQNQYGYTPVKYTVPTTLQFTMDMPGYSAGAGNISIEAFPGNETNQIWFNASNSNSKNVVPCRAPCAGGDSQVSWSTPILNFTNTGTAAFNISIRLDVAQDATLTTWANFSFGPGSAPGDGCSDHTLGSNDTVLSTTLFNFSRALCVNNITNVWLWTNFSDTLAGTISNYLNYTSDNS